jgi:hypothetical protein
VVVPYDRDVLEQSLGRKVGVLYAVRWWLDSELSLPRGGYRAAASRLLSS